MKIKFNSAYWMNTKIVEILFSISVCFELLFYFLNNDIYFQISGFYYPLLFAILFGCFCLFYQKKISKNQKIVLLMFLVLLFSIIVNMHQINTGYLYSYLLMFLLLYILNSDAISKETIEIIKNAYIIATMIIIVIMMVYRERYYEDIANRITIQILNNDKIDPNYLAAFFIGPFIICFDRWINKNRFKDILLAVFIAVGILMTGSRAALLAIILGVVPYLGKIFHILNLKQYRWLFVIVIIAISIFLGIKYDIFSRFSIQGLFDASNARRLENWKNAFYTIIRKPFLGYGINLSGNIIGQFTGDFHPAHNTFLEVWLQFGIFGLILICRWIFVPLIKKSSLQSKSLIIALIIVAMMISAEATLSFWLIIVFANRDIYSSKSQMAQKI